jgi:hypothetical protein
MIGKLVELLNTMDYYNGSENIEFAKGAYRYPRTYKELFKTVKRWRLRKRLK